jgi:hypothetical protein
MSFLTPGFDNRSNSNHSRRSTPDRWLASIAIGCERHARQSTAADDDDDDDDKPDLAARIHAGKAAKGRPSVSGFHTLARRFSLGGLLKAR